VPTTTPEPRTERQPFSAPAQPKLQVSTPPISLTPGGAPQILPITIKNDGLAISQPVSATVNLPFGVSSLGGANRLGGARLLQFDPAPTESTFRCPAGTGTLTCSTGTGLAPGSSVTLEFLLQASENAQGGTVTGSVADGSGVSIAIAVKVFTPLTLFDGVRVSAHEVRAKNTWWQLLWPGATRLAVTVTNTGNTSRTVTLTADHSGRLADGDQRLHCTLVGPLRCSTTSALAPRQQLDMVIAIDDLPLPGRHPVTVTATLGGSKDSTTVPLSGPTFPVPSVGVPLPLPLPLPLPSLPGLPSTTAPPGSATTTTAPPTRRSSVTSTTRPPVPVPTTPPGVVSSCGDNWLSRLLNPVCWLTS
jgi:hypothetical protein